MIIEVIPEAKSYKLDSFSYGVPSDLEKQLKIGSIVLIPFGKKKVRGVVIKVNNAQKKVKDDQEYRIKDIISVDPSFTLPYHYLNIIKWIAQYYFCTPGEALSLFLPPILTRPRKGLGEDHSAKKGKIKTLSQAQDKIFKSILSLGNTKPHLIFGVTGSGKTEIYIHLCMEALNNGKSSIMLVPEIILTPQNIERFKEAFGEEVVLMHSGLSASERYRAYYDFYSGKKRIIIGPRSALLVPNSNIGLIIIDEEHEDAYKQDMSPRYHTVQLAEKIAQQQKAFLVLGSATPNIESFYKTQISEYNLHKLENRYNKLLLPPAEIIDLKNELRSGNNSVISKKLLSAINAVLKHNKQAILFLNRRGSSTFVSCRECGEVINCPNCSIPLVHHNNSSDYLYCHHCDYQTKVPANCPKCMGTKIKFFGAGVEKVEREIKQLFPKARVARIDAETMKNKKDHHNFYQDFKNRRFDIAIGTQMISKGFDIPNVDLVGIISADTGLHLPYFRASEKIFRLITQVSGRSGRENNIGKTIIQTYWPNSRAVQFASNHDYLGFYQQEILNRQKHLYPPFSRIIRVISENEDPKKSLLALEKILPQLEEIGIEYLGPAPCFFQRLRNKWRYHIILKLKNSKIEEQKNKNNRYSESVVLTDKESLTLDLHTKLRELWRNNLNLIWDVDPTDLL